MTKSRDLQIGFCLAHQKRLYSSKRTAKRVARRMDGHLSVYPCSVIPTMFHVGNMSPLIISGEVTRHELYGGGNGTDQVS